jgi:hypothetical protein
MANMSYCRFENTLTDLDDCYDALYEAGGVKEYIKNKDCNEYESPSVLALVALCQLISSEFGEVSDG